MQPDCRRSGFICGHALRRQAGDETGGTSPEPAVASDGGRSQPIEARPSGAATIVSGPLRTTTAPGSGAPRASASSFDRRSTHFDAGNNRANSPSCGVTIVAGRSRPISAASLRRRRQSSSARRRRAPSSAARAGRSAPPRQARASPRRRPPPARARRSRAGRRAALEAGRPAKGATITAVEMRRIGRDGVDRARDGRTPPRRAVPHAPRAWMRPCDGPGRRRSAPRRAYICARRRSSRGGAARQIAGALTNAFARSRQDASLKADVGEADGRTARCPAQ